MIGHLSETKEKYILVIKKFLENKDLYDFPKFCELNSITNVYKISEWIGFVKENLSKSECEMFIEKVLPFETKDVEKNEELKHKVSQMAVKVFNHEAGLIDIIDEITPSINQYIYMVKQLRFNYKMVGARVFNDNAKYCDSVKFFIKSENLDMEFASLSVEEREKVKKIVSDRKLPLNNTTYYEAYRYAQRKEIIKTKVNKSRKLICFFCQKINIFTKCKL